MGDVGGVGSKVKDPNALLHKGNVSRNTFQSAMIFGPADGGGAAP
jgi:hypothetical protein